MQKSKIEWLQGGKVWNPVTGCDPVSPGCDNCYARRMAQRLRGRCGYPEDEPFKVTLHPERLAEPLKIKKPSYVFVCSMGDLFHEDVPEDYIWRVIETAWKADHHIFLILTKRPARMLDVLTRSCWWNNDTPRNIWLGVSVEDQKTADERIPLLLQIPAAKRFVSIEPMLGPVDLEPFLVFYDQNGEPYASKCKKDGSPVIDWVILGGETGPKARPMHSDWARSIREQCMEAGIPFFFKHHGAWWCKQFNCHPKDYPAKELDGKEYREVPQCYGA